MIKSIGASQDSAAHYRNGYMVHVPYPTIETQISQALKLNASILLVGPEGVGKEYFANWAHQQNRIEILEPVKISCSSNLIEQVRSIEASKKIFRTLILSELELLQKQDRYILRDFVKHHRDRSPKFTNLVGTANFAKIDRHKLQASLGTDIYTLFLAEVFLEPLIHRRSDFSKYLDSFMRRFCSKYQSEKSLSDDARRLLQEKDWPNNLNELEFYLERAWIQSFESKVITDANFPNSFQHEKRSIQGSRTEGKLKDAIQALEREMIVSALKRSHGNKSVAAKDLGISRAGLIQKVVLYGLNGLAISAPEAAEEKKAA